MNRSNLSLIKRALCTLTLTGAITLGAGAQAQTSSQAIARSEQNFPIFNHSSPLVGSWLLQYTVTAFGPATVPILNSFTGEGIVIETDTPAPTPVLASLGSYVVSNGHGEWQATKPGRNTYAYTYVKSIYSVNGPGFATATTNVTVTLNPDGTTMTGTLVITFRRNSDGVILFTSAGTLTGARLAVEQP